MKQILQDNTLNDTDKLYKYSQVMTKYMDYKDKTSYESLDKSIPRATTPGVNERVYTSEDVKIKEGDEAATGGHKGNGDAVHTEISKDIGPDEIKINKGEVEQKVKNYKAKNVRGNVTLSDLMQKWITL